MTSSFCKHHDKSGVVLPAEWCFIETGIDAFRRKSCGFMPLAEAVCGKWIEYRLLAENFMVISLKLDFKNDLFGRNIGIATIKGNGAIPDGFDRKAVFRKGEQIIPVYGLKDPASSGLKSSINLAQKGGKALG